MCLAQVSLGSADLSPRNTFVILELSNAFSSVLKLPYGKGHGDGLSFAGWRPSVDVRDDGLDLGGLAWVIFVIGYEDKVSMALDELFNISSEEEKCAEWMLGMVRRLPL